NPIEVSFYSIKEAHRRPRRRRARRCADTVQARWQKGMHFMCQALASRLRGAWLAALRLLLGSINRPTAAGHQGLSRRNARLTRATPSEKLGVRLRSRVASNHSAQKEREE